MSNHIVAEYWEKIYLLLALFSGIVWGVSAFINFPGWQYMADGDLYDRNCRLDGRDYNISCWH